MYVHMVVSLQSTMANVPGKKKIINVKSEKGKPSSLKKNTNPSAKGRNRFIHQIKKFSCVESASCFRVVFNQVSKVNRKCFGFALLRPMIGLKNSRHLLNQSDAKPKPFATWSHAFSRAWRCLRVFASSSYWFGFF